MNSRYKNYLTRKLPVEQPNRWTDLLERCAAATGMFVVRLNRDLKVVSGPFATSEATRLFTGSRYWTSDGKILKQLLPFIGQVASRKIPVVTPILKQLAVAIVPQMKAGQVAGFIICGFRSLEKITDPGVIKFIAKELSFEEQQLRHSLQQQRSVPLNELQHLVEFLQIVSVAIADAELQSIREKHQLESLAVINKISLTMATADTLPQLVDCIFEALPKLLNLKSATLNLQQYNDKPPYVRSVAYDPQTNVRSEIDFTPSVSENTIRLSLNEGQTTEQNWLIIEAGDFAKGTVPDSLSLLALQITTALIRLQHSDLLARERSRLDEVVSNLKASLTAKDEFLSTVSHELRTPLNAILGWAQMIRSGVCTGSHEIEQAAVTIERNARNQARLVSELIDSSRFHTGRIVLTVDTIVLAPLIERVIDSVLPAASARGTTIESYGLQDQIEIKGDAPRIQQALWNLVSNAIKFTPANGQVSIYLFQDGDNAVVQVKDNGIGIEPGYLKNVFERFSQQDSSNDRYFGGLGLGMSITKSVVELHGGRIEAASRGRSQGSTFTIFLPLGDNRYINESAEPSPLFSPITDPRNPPTVG